MEEGRKCLEREIGIAGPGGSVQQLGLCWSSNQKGKKSGRGHCDPLEWQEQPRLSHPSNGANITEAGMPVRSPQARN